MRRLVRLGVGVALLSAISAGAAPASEKALALRQQSGLAPYAPAESFLNGGFTATEMTPAYIFGSVRDFASSRPCPATWLIEAEEQARLDRRGAEPFEYTLVLEEDCRDQVVHYVFVEQPALAPQQWLAWRRQFHKSKTEGEYGETGKQLEQAVKDGVVCAGELRFIVKDGQLAPQPPEQAILSAFPPLYDLKQGKRPAR